MQAPPTQRSPRASRWLKALGLLACGLVVAELLAFALGEGAIGLGHLVQAAPLVLLLVVAWWRPLIGGALILIVGVGLAVAYLVIVRDPQPMVMAMFFSPALVGGLLLVAAGRLEERG